MFAQGFADEGFGNRLQFNLVHGESLLAMTVVVVAVNKGFALH
jgi:hypothetical protein